MSVTAPDELADIRRLRARILLGLVGRFSPIHQVASITFLAVTAWIAFADGALWRIVVTLAGYALLLLGDRQMSTHKRRIMTFSASPSGTWGSGRQGCPS